MQSQATAGTARQVKDVMSDRVICVTRDATLKEIARTMRDGQLGSVPVQQDDKLVGMVTDRDIVIRGIAETDDIATLTAGDLMTERMLYCYEDQPLEEVLRDMADQQVRRLPVMNRDKRLVGIVSLGDLSRTASAVETGETLGAISQPDVN